jgi:hypothetical protein
MKRYLVHPFLLALALALSASCAPMDEEVPGEEPAAVEGDPSTAVGGPYLEALRCPSFKTCGGRRNVDRCSDRNNCGACGRVCRNGAVCVTGKCIKLDAGLDVRL